MSGGKCVQPAYSTHTHTRTRTHAHTHRFVACHTTPPVLSTTGPQDTKPWLCVLLQGAYVRNDVFEDTAALCQRVNKQVGEVFSSPEAVMAKLIQSIFENKLQVGSGVFCPSTHLVVILQYPAGRLLVVI